MSDKLHVNGRYVRICRNVEDIWLMPDTPPKLAQKLLGTVKARLKSPKNAHSIRSKA